MLKISIHGRFDNMTGNFNNMNDFEMGVSLYESEMETNNSLSEEEAYIQRCIAKGKRTKRVNAQKILWYRRHRIEQQYDPHDMNVQQYNARRTSVKARNDMLVFSQQLKNMSIDEYEDVDVVPAKHRRYGNCYRRF